MITAPVGELPVASDHATLGTIVLLVGPPRAGKTSIATAMQDRLDGVWMNLGMDNFKKMTPDRYQPGIGLRPGGERPDLEPLVVALYRAMYEAIASHSRLGINVVADATHHDSYSKPLMILTTAADLLRDLPVLFVGVQCPIDVIRARRIATWGGTGYTESSVTDDPVALWQRALDQIGPYDLTIDTSTSTPEDAADLIGRRLTAMPVPSALQRYASTTPSNEPQ